MKLLNENWQHTTKGRQWITIVGNRSQVSGCVFAGATPLTQAFCELNRT